MNILYTATAFPPSLGGAQLHLHRLALELSVRHGIQVVSHWDRHRTDWLLGTTLLSATTPRDYLEDGIPVHRLGLSTSEKLRAVPWVMAYYAAMGVALPRIANLLLSQLRSLVAPADLVHNVRIGREPLSLASLLLARERGVPFVLTPVHHPRWHGWRYRAFNRIYREADVVFALTAAEAETLISLGVDELRVRVIGHGPILESRGDGPSFMHRHDIRGPAVLFLGQHYRYKGYRELLDAAPLVWRRVPDAHFVFAGPPVGRSERRFAGMSDRRVIRLGAVTLQEKTDALAAAAVLCVPSTQESFGGVYVEAWSMGKPVVGCPIPAVAEVVSDGVDGYLVDQDPVRIAEVLCWILENPRTAAQMGEAGKKKADTRYSWREIAHLVEVGYCTATGAKMTTPQQAPEVQ